MADPATTPAFSPIPHAPAPAPTARPGLVTAAGVIGIVYGAFAALAGVILMFASAVIAGVVQQFIGADLTALGAGLFIALGVVLVVLGILYILLNLQVLKGRNWARIVVLVFAGLGALGGLPGLARGAIVGFAIDVFIIVALLVPASSAWFKAMAARPVA
jgi:hypothetical protein